MKRLVAAVLLPLLLAGIAGTARAQVYGETGVIGFRLNKYGSATLGIPNAETGIWQTYRATIIIAIDSGAVFDYNDDQESVTAPELVSGGPADVAATVLTDGSYGDFPEIKVRVDVFAWQGDSYFLVRHTVVNEASTPLKGYLAMAVLPWLEEEYGAEIVEYDTTSNTGFFYRSGEPSHVGIKVVSGDPYAFHSMDWDTYSLESDDEVTTDTIRCFLTSTPGFDARLEAGIAGAIIHITAGYREIAPGDSSTAAYALVYGTTPEEVLARADSAQQRYDNVFTTSVEPVSGQLPEGYALRQNYPNPFNPSTQIRFDLPAAGFVTLKVCDLLGRDVATLVNRELDAGTYEVPFSGESLPSGMYIATMESGGYRATRKMMLMK